MESLRSPLNRFALLLWFPVQRPSRWRKPALVTTLIDGKIIPPKALYIWAQDQAHVAPDFLAVIDFDEQSSRYGEVIRTGPLPPPGNMDPRLSGICCPSMVDPFCWEGILIDLVEIKIS